MTTNPNMEAIETITVGATSVSSITFSNIPQTYTDLVLKLSTRSTDASARRQLFVKYNDSSSNYTGRRLYGEDGGVGSDTLSGSTGGTAGFSFGITCGDTATANTFGSAEIYIPNYAGSNNKSSSTDSIIENNSSTTYDNWLTANLWSDSSAITKISVTLSAGNFKQYSTATLYGVTSAGYGAKATGGIVTSDADYVYHTFYSSGTFTPTQNLTADALVIAGGGAGNGNYGGGGGGCGGVTLLSASSLTASTGYTVTIGAGGSGNPTPATDGSNSVFSSTTSNGGKGGGGTQSGINAGPGGNAGSPLTTTGGAGILSSYSERGGGGAGASANGGNYTANAGGVGGDGTSSYSSWGSATFTGVVSSGTYYYAGGGGGGGARDTNGGLGGRGGGGNGGQSGNTVGVAGTANTGSGGGGGRETYGGNGGSGIVIVRYVK